MTKLQGPTRRVGMSGAIIAILLAVAVGVMIWRYGQATAQDRFALQALAEPLQAQRAVTVFWRERESMNEYLIRTRRYADELPLGQRQGRA